MFDSWLWTICETISCTLPTPLKMEKAEQKGTVNVVMMLLREECAVSFRRTDLKKHCTRYQNTNHEKRAISEEVNLHFEFKIWRWFSFSSQCPVMLFQCAILGLDVEIERENDDLNFDSGKWLGDFTWILMLYFRNCNNFRCVILS